MLVASRLELPTVTQLEQAFRVGVSMNGISSGRRTRIGVRRLPVRGAAIARAAIASLCIASAGMLWCGSALATGALSGPSPYLTDISCPSASLCVAVGSRGRATTSTDPSAVTPTWYGSDIDGPAFLTAVSCPSEGFCVATENNGRAVSSTDPGAATPTWSPARETGAALVSSISCASTSLCVAVDTDGHAAVSTDPAAGVPSWSATTIDSSSPPHSYPDVPHLDGVSCPSTSLCVAVDSRGDSVTSTNPAAASPNWSTPTAIDSASLSGVSCPSTSLCVAVDEAGRALISTDPTAAIPTWSVPAIVDNSTHLSGISCPSSELCVALGEQGVSTSTDPTAPTPSWSVSASLGISVELPPPRVSCASTSLCAIVDDADALLSSDPTATTPTWSAPFDIDRLPAGTPSVEGLKVTAGPTLTFNFACGGEAGQECEGAATITTTERLTARRSSIVGVEAKAKAKAKAKHYYRTVIIGKATFNSSFYDTDKVKITLGKTGLRLLKRFKRLPASLHVMAGASGEARVPARTIPLETFKVTFKAKTKPRH
jgi:hypothetical protein